LANLGIEKGPEVGEGMRIYRRCITKERSFRNFVLVLSRLLRIQSSEKHVLWVKI
jgi:hypothetical protein